jgi:hypothetical protein
MTTTLLALAVTGAFIDLDWQGDGLHFTGTVDTTTDLLTIHSWQDEDPDRWGPQLPAVWPAIYIREDISNAFPERGTPYRFPLTNADYFDIPDDWDGSIDQWGFIVGGSVPDPDLGPIWRPGIGCRGDFYPQYQRLDCAESLDLVGWPNKRYNELGHYWIFGRVEAETVMMPEPSAMVLFLIGLISQGRRKWTSSGANGSPSSDWDVS